MTYGRGDVDSRLLMLQLVVGEWQKGKWGRRGTWFPFAPSRLGTEFPACRIACLVPPSLTVRS